MPWKSLQKKSRIRQSLEESESRQSTGPETTVPTKPSRAAPGGGPTGSKTCSAATSREDTRKLETVSTTFSRQMSTFACRADETTRHRSPRSPTSSLTRRVAMASPDRSHSPTTSSEHPVGSETCLQSSETSGQTTGLGGDGDGDILSIVERGDADIQSIIGRIGKDC